jgi:hypothetical protein
MTVKRDVPSLRDTAGNSPIVYRKNLQPPIQTGMKGMKGIEAKAKTGLMVETRT